MPGKMHKISWRLLQERRYYIIHTMCWEKKGTHALNLTYPDMLNGSIHKLSVTENQIYRLFKQCTFFTLPNVAFLWTRAATNH